MSIRQTLKEIYYLKIRRMSRHDMLVDHLKKTGMTIGKKCCIFSDKIETAEPYLVSLGDEVMIAPGVMFTTHDASACYYIPGASDLFGRIHIGNRCFIGMGSIVLPGVTIADNCIVGAGSVVTRSFTTPNMVIAGNPARELCTTEELRRKNERYALNVWNIPREGKKEYLLKNEAKFKGFSLND